MTAKRAIGVLTVVVFAGVVAFFIGRQLTGGGSQAQTPNVVDQLPVVQTQAAQKQAEPRFVGQLLGINMAPSLDQLPQAIQDRRSRLIAGGCQPIPLEQASAFAFPRSLVMPPGYLLSRENFSSDTGSNPAAIGCGGQPTGLLWDFTTTNTNGTPANVSIARGVVNYVVQDVATSQVSTQAIGRREAIVITSATSDGLAQRSHVLFPESFGSTSIDAFNLSGADLLKVAEAVAEASR